MKKLLTILMAAAVLVSLTGCKQATDEPNADSFTVTYVTEHGTAPDAITVAKNAVLTAEQLKPISVDDRLFFGWFDGYTLAEADKYIVTKDVTLTAKWGTILGSWDYELSASEDESFPIRYTFKNDGTCEARILLSMPVLFHPYIYLYKGNYTINNNKLTMSLKNDEFSITDGVIWFPFGVYHNSTDFDEQILDGVEDQLFEIVNIDKPVECSFDSNNVIFKYEDSSLELTKSSNIDEAILGIWEQTDQTSTTRFHFKNDNTYYFCEHVPNTYTTYISGKYITFFNYLMTIQLKTSEDFNTWFDYLDNDWEDEILECTLLDTYTVNSTTLEYQNPFTKTTLTSIQF